MKKLLMGLVLCGFASVGFAEQTLVVNKELPNDLQSTQAAITVDDVKEEYCKAVLSMSKTIMDGRQAGIPIDRSLELANKITKDNEFFNKITKQLVIDAYDQPRFSTNRYKKEQLDDFAAKHYISCMKAARLN